MIVQQRQGLIKVESDYTFFDGVEGGEGNGVFLDGESIGGLLNVLGIQHRGLRFLVILGDGAGADVDIRYFPFAVIANQRDELVDILFIVACGQAGQDIP